MKPIATVLILFVLSFSSHAQLKDGDHCTIGAYAVVERSLAACQRDGTGVAKFTTQVNNSRMALFLEENAKNQKVRDLFFKARGISVEDFIRMLDAGPLNGQYTFHLSVPANSPERLQALQDFVAEYNAIQNLTGMVPSSEASQGALPPAPASGATSVAD